jgi:hypothetical protein
MTLHFSHLPEKPKIYVKTTGTSVVYCEICCSPVVDDWDSHMAHMMRIHPRLLGKFERAFTVQR